MVLVYSCLYLTKYNESITVLLDLTRHTLYENLLEYDFRMPPILIQDGHLLTYGSLMSVLRFLVKGLNYVS